MQVDTGRGCVKMEAEMESCSTAWNEDQKLKDVGRALLRALEMSKVLLIPLDFWLP